MAWSGWVELRDRRVDCVVIKISAAGATVQVYEPVVCLISIVLHCPRLEPCRARIIWRRDNLLGLRFLEKPQKIAWALAHHAASEPATGDHSQPVRNQDHAGRDEDSCASDLDNPLAGAEETTTLDAALPFDLGSFSADLLLSDGNLDVAAAEPDDTDLSRERDDGNRIETIAVEPSVATATETPPFPDDGQPQDDFHATLSDPCKMKPGRQSIAEDRLRPEQPLRHTDELWHDDAGQRFAAALAEVRHQAEAALQAAEQRRLGETSALREALSSQEQANAAELSRAVAEWRDGEAARLAEAEQRWQSAEAERLEAAHRQSEQEKQEIRAEAARQRAASEQRMAAAVARWRQEEAQRFAAAAHQWQAKAEQLEAALAALTSESAAKEQESRRQIDEMGVEAERNLRVAQAEWQSETERRLAEAEDAIQAVFKRQLTRLHDGQQDRSKTR